MSMISKLLMIQILILSTLVASETIDEKIIAYEKNRLSVNNKRMEIQEVSIYHKQAIGLEGWYGYIVNLKVKIQGKEVNAKDIVFSNGKLVTIDLQDLSTGESLKESISPMLSSVYYNKKHLIAGNHKAKDKIVLFSDPLCPACQVVVPDIIKYVNENAKTVGLYYYHFPLLRIHPAADTLSRAMVVAREKGIKNIEEKVYKTDFSMFFEAKENNKEKILKGFNTQFKTNITLDEVKNDKIKIEIFNDMQMGDEVMVNSTPTIFVNGKRDRTQKKYKNLGK